MQSQDKTRAYPPATTSELPSTGPDGHEQDESRKENDQTCCEMRLGAVLFVIAYTCIICSFVCCVLGAMQLVVLSSSSTLMSIVPIVTIAVNAVFCAAAIFALY
ncbi:hypothetical protein M3Y94_00639700 [Aphelenchoides besseyi]|nr:hypothetical protein M3Y94_00639700 [Aphelenchoides besseyi]